MLLMNFTDFKALSLEKKLFLMVIVLALLVRVFALFVMPDAPQTDSLYHLSITKYVIQNGQLPLEGIPEMGVGKLPVPLFYLITALPFIILPIPFNLLTVRIFPFIFSALQLVLSYLVLKELFPKKWFYGFALIAMHPLLITFGSFNYTETLASVCVLLAFFIFLRFVKTKENKYLLAMPFALALMALSKESATILVPVFFLAFLYKLWRQKQTMSHWPEKIAYFSIASIILSSAWFIFSFFTTGSFNPSVSSGIANLSLGSTMFSSLEALFLYPLKFNIAFWPWLLENVSSLPFGINPGLAFIAFTLVTFPLMCLIFFFLAKAVHKKQKHSVLVLFCFLLSLFVVFSRSSKFVYGRLLIPVLPLLAIPFSGYFEDLKANWKKFFTLLFVLTAVYALAFSSMYAVYFSTDYNNHVPLYNFISDLPEESAIAIHPNKTRQIAFIAEKEPVSFALFNGLEKDALKTVLLEENVTHVADTCYKITWNKDVLNQFESEGFLKNVYADNCSNLYEVQR